ncbi:MAG: flotillin family protein [Neisseriaceae bacterium]|nr:flotillin family protein [Neisseriaceae bacterium]MBP6863012.1 flotillin family protein [Neisseriaceae bacterium]
MLSNPLIIIAGTAVVALVIIAVIFARLYRRASAERAFVRTGLGGQKVVQDGGAIVLPIFHEVVPINMNTLKLEVNRNRKDSLITRDRMRIDVIAAFFVRVNSTSEGIAAAAKTLGKKTLDPEQLRNLVEDKFVDSLRSTAAEMTMQELQDSRGEFVSKVQSTVAEDLTKNGLVLETVSLTNFNQTPKDFFDPDNAFDAEGLTKLTEETEHRRKQRNVVIQETEVAISEKNKDALQEKLTIAQAEAFMSLAQAQEINNKTAEQAATVATYEAQQRRESETSIILADQAIKATQINTNLTLATQQVEADKAVEIAQTKQAQATQIAVQEKNIALAKKSEEESQAQAIADLAKAKAVDAEQAVITTEETARASRIKQVALIQAEQVAETEAISITVQAQAEQAAAAMQASAITELADADKHKGLAEAEAQAALNQALNTLSSAQATLKFQLALLVNLPKIMAEIVKPMEHIDSINIAQIDGLNRSSGGSDGGGAKGQPSGANYAQQALDAALGYRIQLPVIENLMAAVGLDGTSFSGLTAPLTQPAFPDDGLTPAPENAADLPQAAAVLAPIAEADLTSIEMAADASATAGPEAASPTPEPA